ncbi:MAG: Crp/Fnr family transcriptional regulator [Pikeienuella sp.]
MNAVVDTIFSTGILVHLGMAGYFAGFLFRDQVVLRLLVLAGTASYLAYYYLHPAEPLWGAIFASSMIGLATLIGLMRVLASRMPLTLNAEDRLIFDALPGLEPGEFRRLMALAERVTLGKDTLLTAEGHKPDRLHFTCAGEFAAEKDGKTFKIPPLTFVGEVSFMLDAKASATLVAESGARLVSWEVGRLRSTLSSHPDLKQAFEALLARDMAEKVAAGIRLRGGNVDLSEDDLVAPLAITG